MRAHGVVQVANKCDLGEVEAKLKRDPSKTRLIFQKHFSRIPIIMLLKHVKIITELGNNFVVMEQAALPFV